MSINEIMNNYYILGSLGGLAFIIVSLLMIDAKNKKLKIENDKLALKKLEQEKEEAEAKALLEQKKIEEDARKARDAARAKALKEEREIEAAKKKAEEEAKRKAEIERKKELEKIQQEELDLKKREELEAKLKKEAEEKALLEQKRIEEEARIKKEEAKKKAEEEQKRIAEERLKEKAEAERKRQEELKKIEEKGKTFKEGLEKTKKSGFLGKLNNLFNETKELNEDFLDELEELLLTSDIGPKTADTLFEKIKEGMDQKSIKDSASVMEFLKKETYKMLNIEFEEKSKNNPYIMLFIGVNGSGKTTTIGKLASQYQKEGKKVLLIAGDTFRAAAVEQLEVWSKRSKVDFHAGMTNKILLLLFMMESKKV